MQNVLTSHAVNSAPTVLVDQDYEPPTVVEVGDAAEKILGVGHNLLDVDETSKLD